MSSHVHEYSMRIYLNDHKNASKHTMAPNIDLIKACSLHMWTTQSGVPYRDPYGKLKANHVAGSTSPADLDIAWLHNIITLLDS